MTDSPERIEVELPSGVASELRYLLDLMEDESWGVAYATIEELCSYVMTTIADGSRRPGSWERQVLESMGLVSERLEHHVYRSDYGPPESGEDGD